MSKKFFRAYEAAEYAATITDEWKNETDEVMHTDELLSFMSIADEESEVDEENESFYYVVEDDGSVGVTSDAGKMITWLATPTKAVESGAADHPLFCSKCGAKLTAGGEFCPGCGSKNDSIPQKRHCHKCGAELDDDSLFCSSCGTRVTRSTARSTSATRIGSDRPHGGIGYSKVIDDPKFLEAVKKNKKSNTGCAIAVIGAPFLIMTVYSIFSNELEVIYGMFIGAVVSAVFLAVYLIATLKDKFKKTWDGVVKEKFEKQVRVNAVSKNDDDQKYYWETHYFTIIRRDDGGTEKIEEKKPDSYVYLKVGERVRYHGKLGLIYPYEKYDKSHDEYVICAFCAHRAPIVDDECPKCHRPLLK